MDGQVGQKEIERCSAEFDKFASGDATRRENEWNAFRSGWLAARLYELERREQDRALR